MINVITNTNNICKDDQSKRMLCAYMLLKLKNRNIAKEQKIISKIINLLQSFYEAAVNLVRFVTISLVIPIYQILLSKLDENEMEIKLRQFLKNILKRRFKFLETISFLSVATLLDSRFKFKYLSGNRIVGKIHTEYN